MFPNVISITHWDYCFVSEDVLDRVSLFDIADGEDWIKLSNHLPLILETKIDGKTVEHN